MEKLIKIIMQEIEWMSVCIVQVLRTLSVVSYLPVAHTKYRYVFSKLNRCYMTFLLAHKAFIHVMLEKAVIMYAS